jgi:ribosome maturation factor RimP
MKPKPSPVADRIRGEIEQTLVSFGHELVQLRLGGRVGNRTLTVMIDKPGGVTSADCTSMARRLSVLLDATDPIEGHYTLVVTSPGVNRPLTDDRDFVRFAGERVALRYEEEGVGRHSVRGLLRGVEDGRAVIETDNGEIAVPLSEVEAANILYDWDKER